MKIARAYRALAYLAALCASVGSVSPALANGHFFRETVYGAPLETAWVVPTSYVYASSYYYPTAYIAATSYVSPTAYVAPTAYVTPTYYAAETSYVVSPRAYYTPTVLTSYWPTAFYEPTVAYYLPTVVDVPVVAAATPCESAPRRVARAAPVERVPATPSPQADRSPRESAPASLDSETAPAAGTGISSRVEGSPADEPKKPEPAQGPSKKSAGRLESLEEKPDETNATRLSPAPAPAEKEKKDVTPPNPPSAGAQPSKNVSEVPPVVPSPPEGTKPGDVPLDLPPLGETILRQARRPVLGALPQLVLNGVVKSGETGERLEGVPITLTNRLHRFPDRPLETDAYGRFAVRLPEGDWDVQVTMPSGRVYTVSRLTVSGGKIVDDTGRKIPSLVITR